MLDYLAEVTMSILQKQKERDPKMGYARDFVGAMESMLPACAARREGDVECRRREPARCADAVLESARKLGLGGQVKVGVVTGDDLLPRLDELIARGHALANMDTGARSRRARPRAVRQRLHRHGADRRGAARRRQRRGHRPRDRHGLTMAPIFHEFGWSPEDWDKLAAGMVAGHIIECGAQCSGGNCSRVGASLTRRSGLPDRRGGPGRHLRRSPSTTAPAAACPWRR